MQSDISASPATAGTGGDPGRFRHVFGHHATGIVVVTSLGPDRAPVGMAVGSFTSVSLDPPLAGFFAARSSSTWPTIEAAGAFCANILAADQSHICRAMAARGVDRFAGLDWRPAPSGAPVLSDVVAWVDCDLTDVHDTGDHVFAVGAVRALDTQRAASPLIFCRGDYGAMAPADPPGPTSPTAAEERIPMAVAR